MNPEQKSRFLEIVLNRAAKKMNQNLEKGDLPIVNPPKDKIQNLNASKDCGEKNIFNTADRELLKKKPSGKLLNSGVDPEILMASIELTGYHVEAGARTFVDFSVRMISELGEAVRPFLKCFYSAVREYPGFDNSRGANIPIQNLDMPFSVLDKPTD